MYEKFCLKWDDFSSNVSKSLGLLRSAEYLHDVTLVSDDNKQLSANRLVLSASSEYFRSIFQNSNNKHSYPFLCLDGVSSTDLENILEYIYNGEIQIYQNNLDRFLAVAQRFKLDGLLNDKCQAEVDHQQQETTGLFDSFYDNLQEAVNPKVSKIETRPEQSSVTGRDVAIMERIPVSTDLLEDINQQINEYLERHEDGKFMCILCGKISSGTSSQSKQTIKRHIESTHLEGISIPCPHCEKSFRSRKQLSAHNSSSHKYN